MTITPKTSKIGRPILNITPNNSANIGSQKPAVNSKKTIAAKVIINLNSPIF